MTRPAPLERSREAIAVLREECEIPAIYRPCLAEMPAMVRLLGLGQATANAMSAIGRGGADAEGWKTVLRHLEDWLCDSCKWSPLRTSQATVAIDSKSRSTCEGKRLLLRFVALDQQNVTIAEREALAFLAELHTLERGLYGHRPDDDEPADATSPS